MQEKYVLSFFFFFDFSPLYSLHSCAAFDVVLLFIVLYLLFFFFFFLNYSGGADASGDNPSGMMRTNASVSQTRLDQPPPQDQGGCAC